MENKFIASVRKLVTATEMPFGQIASLCGLEKVGHLGEICKAEFGMTMSEYRERFARNLLSKPIWKKNLEITLK